MNTAHIDYLDAEATLALAESSTRARRFAEVEDLLVVAHWADLHSDLPIHDPDLPAHAREEMIQPGGDGTPPMQEFAVAELAFARQTHHATTRAAIADILDLRHRLPATFAVMVALECEPWVARQVAVISRHVDADAVGIVDRAIAAAITGDPPATVLDLARAKTIEADPDHEAARLAFEAHRRYVALSRSDDTGYRNVIARVIEGDAVCVDALVDRVADILAKEQDHNRDELRAMAFGWLARPADLLQLLLEHTEIEDESQLEPQPESHGEDDHRPVWSPAHLAQTLAGLAALTCRQLASLRPKAVVHVHLTQAALSGQSGVARVEGLGPMLVQHLADLLGHADISLQPVRDLNGRIRINDYEHPDRLKDHTWQQAGGDVFPYAPAGTRLRVDYDHPTPYDKNGPPGQTGTHNSGPLWRTHHSWKTFGGYQCRQSGPGRYLWRTPRGRYYLRDHTGTHPLDADRAEMIMSAPISVDLYPA
ncbi:MAG: hypothetical protein ABIS91_03650 [Nocardioides sp.]|uniref:hypothetical protein n=1 Tax=Nocardioides sp. TaxID=35761 RepID=UPI0032672961